jgi:hypothetical protein
MTSPDEPAVDLDPADADLFDDAGQAPMRTNRLTVVLLVALLVVGGFAGGVLVQKHHDTGLLAGTTGVRRAGAGVGTGAGSGSGAGRQGGRATAAPGAGSGGGSASGDETGADGAGAGPPVVIGTVRTVDTDAIEVTDPTGAVVRVFVPKTATVTTLGLGALAYGMPVSVAGTKGVDGSVTATSVTVRGGG